MTNISGTVNTADLGAKAVNRPTADEYMRIMGFEQAGCKQVGNSMRQRKMVGNRRSGQSCATSQKRRRLTGGKGCEV